MKMRTIEIFFLIICTDSLGFSQYLSSPSLIHVPTDRSIYLANPGYPQIYQAGLSYQWNVTSDGLINMRCNINMFSSPNCGMESLVIQSLVKPAQKRSCGTGDFEFSSESNQLIVSLISSASVAGGTFVCVMWSVPAENCNCGWKNPSRIYGGENTGAHEFPMMSAIFDMTTNIFVCGATVINNQQVLTAAHCLNKKNKNSLSVLVGEYDLVNVSASAKYFKVQNFVMHPQWNEVNATDFDVGIVTVEGVIPFNQVIGPACLPFGRSTASMVQKYVYLLGWGNSEFGGAQSQRLQKTNVEIIDNALCERAFGEIGSRQICHYRNGSDACQFDSGGPVLWQNPATRRIILIGVISYGSTCGDGIPGVNSRVESFLDWIQAQSPRGFQYCQL